MFAGSTARSGPSLPGARVEISDDDAGSAMFDLRKMSPGHAVSHCITVAYRGPSKGAVVRLHGGSVGSGLGPYVDVIVEEGYGGRFSDCRGFRGRALYRGSLAAFTNAHRDFRTGLAAFSPLKVAASETFRFSVVLRGDAAAQGLKAQATFTWEAREVTPAEPSNPGRRAPPTLSGIPKEAAPRAGGAPAQVTLTPSTEGAGSPEGIVNGRRGRDLLDWIHAVALEALKKGGLPLLLLLIVVAFLMIQDRIDRRDPKLALAPIHSEPDVSFRDRPSPLVKQT